MVRLFLILFTGPSTQMHTNHVCRAPRNSIHTWHGVPLQQYTRAWTCLVSVYSDLRELEGIATVRIYEGTLISGYFTQVNLSPNYLSVSPMRVSSPKGWFNLGKTAGLDSQLDTI